MFDWICHSCHKTKTGEAKVPFKEQLFYNKLVSKNILTTAAGIILCRKNLYSTILRASREEYNDAIVEVAV